MQRSERQRHILKGFLFRLALPINSGYGRHGSYVTTVFGIWDHHRNKPFRHSFLAVLPGAQTPTTGNLKPKVQVNYTSNTNSPCETRSSPETRHPRRGALPDQVYLLRCETVGLVYEIREAAFERGGLGAALAYRRGLLGVAGSQVLERRGGEAALALGTTLADFLYEGVGGERGVVFELPSRLLDAELDAQPVQKVAPRLRLERSDRISLIWLLGQRLRSRCSAVSPFSY